MQQIISCESLLIVLSFKLQLKTYISFDFCALMALGWSKRSRYMGQLRESLSATDKECGLPTALEGMGERWSFMILRGAFGGIRHFEEFLTEIGIARNILANRLSKLTSEGILHRTPCPDDRRKVEYRLTPKGLDLLPTMIALRQWGEKWGTGICSNPVLVDERDHQPILPITIRSHDDRILGAKDLCWIDATEIVDLNGRPEASGQGSIRKLSAI
jgi:DNA-binding HxlR family transcriptional regulator